MAADGAALIAAAVRAAILAKALRRTVAATAAAVASVALGTARNAGAAAAPRAPAGSERPAAPGPDGASPEVLAVALSAARRARRKRKKENHRAARGGSRDAAPGREAMETEAASPAPLAEAAPAAERDTSLEALTGAGTGGPAPRAAAGRPLSVNRFQAAAAARHDLARGATKKTLQSGSSALREHLASPGRRHDTQSESRSRSRSSGSLDSMNSVRTSESALAELMAGNLRAENDGSSSRPPGTQRQ